MAYLFFNQFWTKLHMLESQNEYKQGCTDFVHISSNNDKEMYLIFVDFRVFFIYHKYNNISFILTLNRWC